MPLIQQDLIVGSGDQLLTLDTDTGLEWLNLTATAKLSVLDILGGAGNFATTYGFRYATTDEIALLFTHAGIRFEGMGNAPGVSDEKFQAAMVVLLQLMNGAAVYTDTTSPEVMVQSRGMKNDWGVGTPSATTPVKEYRLRLYTTKPDQSRGVVDISQNAGQRSAQIGSYLVSTDTNPI